MIKSKLVRVGTAVVAFTSSVAAMAQTAPDQSAAVNAGFDVGNTLINSVQNHAIPLLFGLAAVAVGVRVGLKWMMSAK